MKNIGDLSINIVSDLLIKITLILSSIAHLANTDKLRVKWHIVVKKQEAKVLYFSIPWNVETIFNNFYHQDDLHLKN
ncbi:hypothetical protein FM036_43495 [Nostoc sp. HG1]|nr:hypothetical protein [Nostoc sp. HG1]